MSRANNKDTRRVSVDIFLVSFLLTLNIFHTLLYCLCCYFEQVNTHWVNIQINVTCNFKLEKMS